MSVYWWPIIYVAGPALRPNHLFAGPAILHVDNQPLQRGGRL